MIAICRRMTWRITWAGFTRLVKIAAVPVLPAGSRLRAAAVALLQLRHLREAQFLELELRLERVDGRLVGRRIDTELHAAGLERLVRRHRRPRTDRRGGTRG